MIGEYWQGHHHGASQQNVDPACWACHQQHDREPVKVTGPTRIDNDWQGCRQGASLTQIKISSKAPLLHGAPRDREPSQTQVAVEKGPRGITTTGDIGDQDRPPTRIVLSQQVRRLAQINCTHGQKAMRTRCRTTHSNKGEWWQEGSTVRRE